MTSCQSYLLNTVSSSNTKKSDSTGVFKAENDSLVISYSFNGNNAPINIEIYNKMDEPLYVNWKKSAVIVADKAYSYIDDKIMINGTTTSIGTQLYKQGNTYTDGTIAAVAKLSKDESFIPPHASSGRSIFILNNIQMNEVEATQFKKKIITYFDGSGLIHSKSADFTATNSPLTFKSYLTLYTLKENKLSEFASAHDFYISNITKAMIDPQELYQYGKQPGDIIIKQ